jgi:assimilatory nitrate reductase catalytic subunit
VQLSDAMRPGEIFVPMHWTAQVSRAGRINGAVNPAVDPVSGQPELKHTPVDTMRIDVQWHGTILARRPIMLPDITYWTRIRGSGFEAYLLAGEEPIAAARQKLSAALRARNPGPWLEGELLEGRSEVGAVIGDGVLEAVMSLSETRDETARDRLAPFMSMGRLSVEQRNALLQGGDGADRGGEICACFGISTSAVTAAIAGGATSLDTIGAITRAGSNCGSCRPELRALVRAARAKQAA